MPDTRKHRGPHPADEKLFAASAIGDLRAAMADYCMLLSRGYAEKSALKLVGDRFSITSRQRMAIMRSACGDARLAGRLARLVPVSQGTAGLAVDGYNLISRTD